MPLPVQVFNFQVSVSFCSFLTSCQKIADMQTLSIISASVGTLALAGSQLALLA